MCQGPPITGDPLFQAFSNRKASRRRFCEQTMAHEGSCGQPFLGMQRSQLTCGLERWISFLLNCSGYLLSLRFNHEEIPESHE